MELLEEIVFPLRLLLKRQFLRFAKSRIDSFYGSVAEKLMDSKSKRGRQSLDRLFTSSHVRFTRSIGQL